MLCGPEDSTKSPNGIPTYKPYCLHLSRVLVGGINLIDTFALISLAVTFIVSVNGDIPLTVAQAIIFFGEYNCFD